jgi:hypothetical protein
VNRSFGRPRFRQFFLRLFTVAALVADTSAYAADAPSGQADRLNLRDFGAALDGDADDSPAWIRAIEAANASAAAGRPVCIYVPVGISRIVEPLPMFRGPGCVLGDGSARSIVKVDRAYAGDVFSWSEAWMGPDYPMQGSTVNLRVRMAGPTVAGIGIVGDRFAPAAQNAFVFYDRADFVSFRDVAAFYLNGRCLYFGVPKNKPVAYMRESKLYEIRFWGCGSANAPAVEFDSVGPGPDAANEIAVFGMDIIFPHGDGLVIRNSGSGVVRLIQFYQLRVEGVLRPEQPIAGDLVRIGDASRPGLVRSIRIEGFDAEEPYAGHAALRITGPTAAAPFDITLTGAIGPGPGAGVVLEAGRSLRLQLDEIGTSGPKLSVEPRVGSDVQVDGNGAEAAWLEPLAPEARRRLKTPAPAAGR